MVPAENKLKNITRELFAGVYTKDDLERPPKGDGAPQTSNSQERLQPLGMKRQRREPLL